MNSGITLPLLPRTLPNLTVVYVVVLSCESDWTNNSAALLVAPITLVGLTALSVDIMTKFSTAKRLAFSANILVPKMLLVTASIGLYSIIGTCL